ncbi:phosphatase PAP2 family protein [Candidatus Parcubacteria bacterium]|nr:MAG: phosphatase PAP2 family protein [Candidatus Parcubacteria bacterium]
MPGKKTIFLSSISLFLGFIYFSYLVAKEKFTQLDFDITVKFQDNLSSRFDYPFSALSVLGSAEITTLIWIIIFLFILLIKRYWLTAATLFSFFASVIIEVYGKVAVFHPGPPFFMFKGVIDYNFPSHYVHTEYSYPSGHMTRTAFLIAFIFTYLYLKGSGIFRIFVQISLIGLLVAMFVSRIYLGEHWVSDVIGGLLLGGSLGLFTTLTLPLKPKEVIRDEILSEAKLGG